MGAGGVGSAFRPFLFLVAVPLPLGKSRLAENHTLHAFLNAVSHSPLAPFRIFDFRASPGRSDASTQPSPMADIKMRRLCC